MKGIRIDKSKVCKKIGTFLNELSPQGRTSSMSNCIVTEVWKLACKKCLVNDY